MGIGDFLKGAVGGIGLGGGGGGGSLLDTLRGEGTGRYRGELAKLIGQERESDKLYGDATIAAIQKGNEARVGGYNDAIAKASDVSRASRRDAVERATKAGGELTTRFGAGGRFGTTALDNARLGLSSALSRELEGINSGFAGLFGDLSVGKGNAEAVGQGQIAAFQQDRGQQESELYRLLTGTIRQPRQGLLSGILGAVGAGVGASYGGPAGGAVGGELGSALGGSFERV